MKVKSCCCFDLRTGGLIIAGFEILSGLLALTTGLFVPLIKFTVGGCLIFGILKNNSGCLIPFLVESIISIAGSIGVLIYIGYKSQTKPEDVDAFFDDYITNEANPSDIKHIIIIAIILVILLTIESIYSWIVIFTLYQEITVLSHKVQDSVVLDNYSHNPNLSIINNYPPNSNPLGNYPPSSDLIMSHYPANVNLGINSYPSNPHQNNGNNAADGLSFTYN